MALSSDYTDRIFYDSQGHTGNSYYYRLIRRSDGGIWDYTTEAFALTTSWLNSVNVMVETGTTGAFPVLIDKDLPANDTFDVVVYLRAAAVPANTDLVQTQYGLSHGGVFGF